MAKKRKNIPIDFEEEEKQESAAPESHEEKKAGDEEKAESKKEDLTDTKQDESSDSDVSEWKDRLIRLQAEFSNYKKRVEKESLELSNYLKAEIIKDFLPVLDDFKHMMENVQQDHQDVKAVLDGMEMIFKKYSQVIEKYGVEKIDSLETEFDPEMHEALMVQPVDSEEKDNTIIQVYKEGYKMKDKVIRPAQVIVGKFEKTESEPESQSREHSGKEAN